MLGASAVAAPAGTPAVVATRLHSVGCGVSLVAPGAPGRHDLPRV